MRALLRQWWLCVGDHQKAFLLFIDSQFLKHIGKISANIFSSLTRKASLGLLTTTSMHSASKVACALESDVCYIFTVPPFKHHFKKLKLYAFFYVVHVVA